MRTCRTPLAALMALAASAAAHATEVAVCTDAGRIVIALDSDAAPAHVENFLNYVARGHYTGTVFHRVIEDFMIQGGGYDRNLVLRPAPATVDNESRNGLSNTRGTVAAARTGDPHSAAAQFFINMVDNDYLDASSAQWGYTVFGRVIEGMDVVDEIGAVPTGRGGPFPSDVPDPVPAILSIAVLDPTALAQVDGPDPIAALLARIDAAQETDSPADVLAWISHYRAACAPAGPDLLVTEARNAAAIGSEDRARFALEEFFATALASHTDYAEAERLYETFSAPAGASIEIDSCTTPVAPDIPDGTKESLETMLSAQSEIQRFMGKGTDYLECMDELIESAAATPELRETLIESYNEMVDLTQQVGDDFNRQVRAFRARQ